MSKIEVSIIALAESESKKGNFVLILEDYISKRRIPIIVGILEAQAIAIYMERLNTPRPMTHDLFKNTIDLLGSTITEVYIDRLENEIFYSKITIKTSTNDLITVDARPSDALALGLRFSCPIYASSQVLEHSGYDVDEKGKEKKGSYAVYSMQELEELLQKIIKKEDYESAARVRDAIERRRNIY